MTNVPPPPPAGPSPSGPFPGTSDDAGAARPWWKRKRVLIPTALIALFVIGGALSGGGDEEEVATATPTTEPEEEATESETEPEATEPETEPEEEEEEPEEPEEEEEPAEATGIGAVQGTGSGGLARVNAVEPNAAPLNQFSQPEPGSTFTRLDVEICAGEDGQQANPLYWVAGLDDNSDATAALGGQDYETVGLRTGECQRGTVDVEVPEGRSVSSVYLTSPGLSEIARWQLAEPAVEVTGPLTPSSAPERTPLGSTADTPEGPATAYGVTDGVAPANDFATPPAGTTFTRLDVEVSAGDEARSTNPLYWYGITAANRWLSAELGAQDYETGDIAPGQCRRGTVDVAVPDGDSVVAVALTDPGLDQVAAWSR